jgi:2-isopropylmalate synthase
MGSDAFRTSTGIHAAAVIKAKQQGNRELEDLIYSAVPASWFDAKQIIEVGPMSGISNINLWLTNHGYEDWLDLAEGLLQQVKDFDRVLKNEELHEMVKEIIDP